MATNLGVFRFQPLTGEDTIANDGSSFGAPYFSQARTMLQGIRVLALTPESVTYPENYEPFRGEGVDPRRDHRQRIWHAPKSASGPLDPS